MFQVWSSTKCPDEATGEGYWVSSKNGWWLPGPGTGTGGHLKCVLPTEKYGTECCSDYKHANISDLWEAMRAIPASNGTCTSGMCVLPECPTYTPLLLRP